MFPNCEKNDKNHELQTKKGNILIVYKIPIIIFDKVKEKKYKI